MNDDIARHQSFSRRADILLPEVGMTLDAHLAAAAAAVLRPETPTAPIVERFATCPAPAPRQLPVGFEAPAPGIRQDEGLTCLEHVLALWGCRSARAALDGLVRYLGAPDLDAISTLTPDEAGAHRAGSLRTLLLDLLAHHDDDAGPVIGILADVVDGVLRRQAAESGVRVMPVGSTAVGIRMPRETEAVVLVGSDRSITVQLAREVGWRLEGSAAATVVRVAGEADRWHLWPDGARYESRGPSEVSPHKLAHVLRRQAEAERAAISTAGLDPADVLAVLFNAARAPERPTALPRLDRVKAADVLARRTLLTVVEGRRLFVDLGGRRFDPTAYDEHNGPGAARRAIDVLRQAGAALI